MNAPTPAGVLPARTPFERLYSLDVSKHVEKKNNLSYLSWAWAVAELMKADPSANWQIHAPTVYQDGTMMVACTVTAFDKPVYMWLPVMDHRNKAIQNPNAFDINKNQMRCLVKAISCHGLGLYIYAGEDLPEDAKEEPKKHLPPVKAALQSVQINDEDQAYLRDLSAELVEIFQTKGVAAAFDKKEAAKLDADQTLFVWDCLAPNSAMRAALKKEGQNRRLVEQA